jgi:hypothetical protein
VLGGPEFAKARLGLREPLGPIDRAKVKVNGSSAAVTAILAH